MKIFVKTLKGTHLKIEVKFEDTVADMKKNIEITHGADIYPAAQQMLIHQGKVLKDDTTLEENKVSENNFVVIMLMKNKVSKAEESITSTAPTVKASSIVFDDVFQGIPEIAEAPPASANDPSVLFADILPEPQAGQQVLVHSARPNANPLDLFPQDSLNTRSNASHANTGGANAREYLHTSPHVQAFRAKVLADPSIMKDYDALTTMLRELGKQDPQLVGLIQENLYEFVCLFREPIEGGDGFGQLEGEMPEAIEVTPEEYEAIERLEAMGFDREVVVEVFFACDKDEELAANYLLDHIHEM